MARRRERHSSGDGCSGHGAQAWGLLILASDREGAMQEMTEDLTQVDARHG